MTTSVPGNLKSLADSYGGIIGAINQLRISQGLGVKTYDASYHGIIQALLDLNKLGGSEIGELPPGWGIDEETGEGYWQFPPKNGNLWFDERQGRLMVWVDDGYYQTNGADGLTFIGELPPSEEVAGGQWYNPSTKSLYVYDGANWNLIDTATTLSTESLPVSEPTETFAASLPGHIVAPLADSGVQPSQGQYNRWVARALKKLEEAVIVEQSAADTYSGSNPPDNPKEGDFWFDTSELNLYVYYVDNDSGQWVLAFNTLNNNEFITLSNSLSTLADNTAQSDATINARIDALPFGQYVKLSELTAAESVLNASLSNLSSYVGDLSRFATPADIATEVSTLSDRLDVVEAAEPDLSDYVTSSNLNTTISGIQAQISTNASEAESYTDAKVAAATALIPDISGKANTVDLQAFISQAAQNYFPRLGGTLNGTFGMQKSDIGLPSFDFSNEHYYGQKVFKFRTNSNSEQYVEFGTNDNPWEYAWQFQANEDFCWKHTDAGKVFSISEDGPACEKLLIGSFGNNTGAGRNIGNYIEVGERLRTYQDTFEAIRTAVNQATDFDSLKTRLLEAVNNI